MDQIELIPPASIITDKPISMPGSKSITNRTLIMAAISEKSVKLVNHLWSDDILAMTDCLRLLGIKVIHCKDYLQVIGNLNSVNDDQYLLDARLSGTTMRFILALACVVPGIKIIGGEQPLNERPIGDLVDALCKLGAKITYLGKKGCPPVRVDSGVLSGKKTSISGEISSQFLSALLLISPVLDGVKIDVIGEQISKSYVDMTLRLMNDWGVKVINDDYKQYKIAGNQKYEKEEYIIDGDFSAGSYFGAVAALFKSQIILKNLRKDSNQGDKQFFDILEKMGSKVEYSENSLKIIGHGVAPMDVNMELCPDQAQTLAVLLSFAKGKSTITGVRSLRVKETERVNALQNELGKMGIQTESPNNDTLVIFGGNPKPAVIDTYGDHRMAMSFAIAGMKINGIKIIDPQVVKKTFPDFWEKLESVGVEIKRS